jgi:aminotransferase
MINVFGSDCGEREAGRASDAIRSNWMGMGRNVTEFEKAFAAHLHSADFVMLDSGSNALHMAVKLLDLPPGSEVIVPSFTWVACAQAVLLAGCKVRFCDVALDTQNVRAEDIEKVRTPDTKAVMVVHYAGLPCNMREILDLGLPVIEDAAHAVDSLIGPFPCGTIGDIGIFSFDAVKNLATPEGGGLVARNPERMQRARRLRCCGAGSAGFSSGKTDRWWEYDISDVWPKTVPNDVSAAVGRVQLDRLDELQEKRKHVWEIYQKEFSTVPWITRPVNAPHGEKHSYFTYFVRVLNGRRDELAKYLKANGVYTTLRYHPLHLNPLYGQQAVRLANCEVLNEVGLNLPLHPGMSEADAERVVGLVKAFC